MRLNKVVFPAPLAPITPTIDPLGTSKDTSDKAVRPPNLFVIFLISNNGLNEPTPGL